MRKNLFYAMIATAFLMVGCGSSGETNAATTNGDSLTGKAGVVDGSTTPTKFVKKPSTALAGSDIGK